MGPLSQGFSTTSGVIGARKGYASREYVVDGDRCRCETDARTQASIADVAGFSSWTNANLMAIDIAQNAVSRAHKSVMSKMLCSPPPKRCGRRFILTP